MAVAKRTGRSRGNQSRSISVDIEVPRVKRQIYRAEGTTMNFLFILYINIPRRRSSFIDALNPTIKQKNIAGPKWRTLSGQDSRVPDAIRKRHFRQLENHLDTVPAFTIA